VPSSSLRAPGPSEDLAASKPEHKRPSEDLVDGFIRRQEWMEPVAYFVQTAVGRFYSSLGPIGAVAKDAAHGTKLLRHPLHPALTDAPLGAWLVGVILDWVARSDHAVGPAAGNVALAFGTLAAVAAAVTGYTDFYDTEGLERRTALTHGLVMTSVLVLETISLVLRWSGAQLPAILLATVALLLAMAGMYVGGHLTFRFGTMVNRNAFAQGSEMFVKVGPVTDFPENTMKRVDVDGMAALVVRLDGRLRVIAADCSHAGGPLEEGDLNGSVVTCPRHGARFDICSGRALSGPATFAQPVFEVRERRDNVELRVAFPLR
jgi:nitrite reductase/ring-hydroxylating ferredoxin subunit